MMANVTTSVTQIYQDLQAFRTVYVQNGGPGALYLETSDQPAANVTVNSTNSVYVAPNDAIYVDVHRAGLFGVSNSTASVKYI